MQGRAVVEYENVIPRRIMIFSKYMDPSEAPVLAQRLASNWKPVIIRIKPEKFISFDYSKGFGVGKTEGEPIEI